MKEHGRSEAEALDEEFEEIKEALDAQTYLVACFVHGLVKSARRQGIEEAAKVAKSLEIDESDGNDQWWEGWNAACEQLDISIRSLTKD